jgi:two-component system chemotaxis sensor kinase CheA
LARGDAPHVSRVREALAACVRWIELTRLPIRLKLMVLAGVPVLGALVLATLIARDAQRNAESAATLGSIEDLARLSAEIGNLVHALEIERSALTLEIGTAAKNPKVLDERRTETDGARRRLSSFLAARSVSALPVRLARNLLEAEEGLGRLDAARGRALDGTDRLEQTRTYFNGTIHELISATAALAHLTDDGQLMRAISGLVSVLEVKERASQEHAVLNQVFAISEYPPGVYKELVTLITEEKDYVNVLQVNAEAAIAERLAETSRSASSERALALRQVALDTLDDSFNVDPHEWDRVQGAKVLALRELEIALQAAVKGAAVTKAEDARRSVRISYSLVGGVLLCSALLAWLIGRGIANSIGSLAAAADRVRREKDFGVRARKTSEDELGALTDAFNEMLMGIEQRDAELTHHRENLEQLVELRTLALHERNAAMRLVLDNVEQGLATMKLDGTLAPERSRVFDEWFGAAAEAAQLSEVLSARDGALKARFELGWEQLVAGFLPLELAIDQMPKRIEVLGRHYALEYRAILEGADPTGILLVVNDVTAELTRERREKEQREVLGVVERVMRDRTGFLEFYRECDALVASLSDDALRQTPLVVRAVHTLKGNCAIFNAASVAEAAHELETRLSESARPPSAADLEPLRVAWRVYAERVRSLGAIEGTRGVEVSREELDELIFAAGKRVPYPQLTALLSRLRYERASVRLRRVAEQLEALAQRLGKSPVHVEVQASDDVRFPTERWATFWSNFVHVVRNAIDHGVEPGAERLARGKSPEARVLLSAVCDGAQLVVEVSDDGRGIAWERVRDRARSLGLPHESPEELTEALFTEGVSTASSVTAISGRGVGLTAIRDATRALEGRISVLSTEGQGTCFRFEFPVDSLAAPAADRPAA